jgi:hypothetical protein
MPVTQQQAALFAELRLAGASTFEAVEVLLAAQQIDHVIDLVSKAWMHERRGKGGQFASSGGTLTSGLRHSQRAQRRSQLAAARNTAPSRSAAPAPAPVTHETVQQIAHKEAAQMAVKVGARVAAGADRVAAEHAQQSMAKISKQIEEANQYKDVVEKKKSRKKGIAMLTSLIGGAGLAYLENKMGAPGLAQAFTSITPAAAEALFEMKNEL